MKKSKFIFSYRKSENEIVMYNTFSKALVVVSNEEFEAFEKVATGTTSVLDESTVEELKNQGFILGDGYDEIAFLKYFHYKTKFSNELLSLTIAPTLDCNFACPYCYETARKGKMSQEVQDKLLEYITKKIAEGAKRVDITWYGGEPLLCTEIVDYLASNIKMLCEKAGVRLDMSLVTNGYLLSQNIVEMFVRNDIDNIQITLDGMEENHDKRRYLHDGRGTFQKIVSNLSLFKGTSVNVNIRMNVDVHNRGDYAKLKKIIDAIDGVKMGVYPAAVEPLNERKEERKDYYMSSTEFEKFIRDSYVDSEVCDGGLDVIDNRRYFCAAELENSYVVDEKGNFYK